MSTQQERRRAPQEKLDQIEEQKKEGSLVVRKLTPEELKENQPRPPREKRPPAPLLGRPPHRQKVMTVRIPSLRSIAANASLTSSSAMRRVTSASRSRSPFM